MLVKAPENLHAGLVTIGLPVYNGARYLREALDSLIAQDYPDFEIIISDNASEDETEAICRNYAARDSRIRYFRAERNMGALWNAVQVYQAAKGEYFLLAADDDLRHPEYLSRCVAALERNPRALFCCTDIRLINEEGHDISATFEFQSYRPVGPTPRARLLALLRSTTWLHIYSLIRTPALAQTRLGQHMWGADVVQVAEMCLRGEVAEVPEKLFDYRWFSAKTSDDLARGISTAEATVCVSWSDLAVSLIESVSLAPLRVAERVQLKWMIVLELCFRNSNVAWGIRREGFEPARRALRERKYRRAVTLGLIGLMTQTVGFVEQILKSVRYRTARMKATYFSRKRAPSGR